MIRFADQYVWNVEIFERLRECDELVNRCEQRDGHRRRGSGASSLQLRRVTGCVDDHRGLDTNGGVGANDHVVGGPTAAGVNA
jgi:hypothetical protein